MDITKHQEALNRQAKVAEVETIASREAERLKDLKRQRVFSALARKVSRRIAIVIPALVAGYDLNFRGVDVYGDNGTIRMAAYPMVKTHHKYPRESHSYWQTYVSIQGDIIQTERCECKHVAYDRRDGERWHDDKIACTEPLYRVVSVYKLDELSLKGILSGLRELEMTMPRRTRLWSRIASLFSNR